MMARNIPVCLAIVAVIGVGVVHGYWTDRWSVAQEVAAAAARLDQLPQNIGDWQAQPLEGAPQDDPGLVGQVYLRYVNRKTGDSISVAGMCGRAGPVCIHTPDVCYKASGYNVGKRAETEIKQDGKISRFFTMEARKPQAADSGSLRIFWSWFDGDQWQALQGNPRLKYGGQRPLYKFYVIRQMNSPLPPDQDPCVEFLRQFLPEAEKALTAG